METMKAAVWTEIGKIKVMDVEVPRITRDQVLVKVMSAGLCATDLHVYTGRFRYGEPPHILGHEVAGEICQVGDAVEGWNIGDRVVVETSIGCGRCRFCISGQRHLCPEMTEIGFTPNNGAYAQYMAAPAKNLFRIPDELSDDGAGIMESVVCPVGALYRLGVRFSETVVVFGVGPAGIGFIQGAKAMGAGKIIAVARNDFRLERARGFGADILINTKKENAEEAIMKETGGIGADLVIDATGSPGIIALMPGVTRRAGHMILYGLPEDDASMDYPVKEIIMKQLEVYGAVGNPSVWEPLLRMAASGVIRLDDMVTHTFPLERIEEAFACLENPDENVLKAVIHPWD